MESTPDETFDEDETLEEETDEIVFVEGSNKDEEDSDDENDLATTLSQLNINEAKSISEVEWYNRFVRDFGNDAISKRPLVTPWHHHYINSMKFDDHRGIRFADKMKKTIFELCEDSLTSVQEIVLSGDVDTAKYQIEREKKRATATAPFEFTKLNSLLHFAVVNGSIDMIKLVLTYEKEEIEKRTKEIESQHQKLNARKAQKAQNKQKKKDTMLNKGDIITGFTGFHWGVFIENKNILRYLIKIGADVDKKDNYGADAFDYARVLGFIPNYKGTNTLQMWNPELNKIDDLTTSKFEEYFKVKFTPFPIADSDFIEELLFSGLSIKPDHEFRKKYVPLVYENSGDNNVILAKINDNVGWGVFAARDFKEGEFVVRYGGKISKTEKIKDKSYNMASGFEGMGLDASYYRNMGGMINHSATPNCESQCIFDRGAEQAIIVAKTPITKGTQLLIDYSKNYWTKGTLKGHKLEDITNVMSLHL